MPGTVTVAFVKQYSNTLFHLAQQKGSRLKAVVRNETQQGDSAFYDRLGKATAQLKTSRHGDTPLLEAAHTRRMVTLSDYEWATLLDKQDKIRMMIDPTSAYMVAASNGLGRSIDDVIIAAALGNAYGGNNGGTTVAQTAGQFIGAVDGGALSRLNVDTLRKIKKIFWVNEADGEPLHIVVDGEQLEGMLGQTEVTNSDYNTVKALAQGEIDTFMGFKFHHSERLSASGTFTINTTTGAVTLSTGNGDASRQCFAWAESGILLATGLELDGRIDERNDKSYATQVYARLSCGATRMEEEKVVGVLCKATA